MSTEPERVHRLAEPYLSGRKITLYIQYSFAAWLNSKFVQFCQRLFFAIVTRIQAIIIACFINLAIPEVSITLLILRPKSLALQFRFIGIV